MAGKKVRQNDSCGRPNMTVQLTAQGVHYEYRLLQDGYSGTDSVATAGGE